MNMRECMLALIKGQPHDRVPFVQYDGIIVANEKAWKVLGRENFGLLRWSHIHRVVHPNCKFVEENIEDKELHGKKITLQTPVGSLTKKQFYEPTYNSASIKEYFVKEKEDYQVFHYYLKDCKIIEDIDQFKRDQKELGDDGLPLVAVERTPYQQLWIEWMGLETLTYHMIDYPGLVQKTIKLLEERANQIFQIVYESPLDFVDFPDNISSSVISPRMFKKYCVPYYRKLSGMLAEKNIPVFVHMDGDLKPFWDMIGDSGVRGLDSLSPPPDNDTPIREAVKMWPEMRLFVNFPSSVHLKQPEIIKKRTQEILKAAGHTGRLQIQISENVPPGVWEKSLPIISQEIDEFGKP